MDLIGALIPGCKGATIAAEMLDASESLRELCAKCGAKLTAVQGTLITCTGICLPRWGHFIQNVFPKLIVLIPLSSA